MITRATAASLVAGVLYAFVPFKWDHLSHVQIIASGWIPLTLAALLLFWRSGSVKHAALFAIAFVMNGLTNVYWLMFTAFAVAVSLGEFYSSLLVLLLLCAMAIATSRILLGMHFLSDVVVGALLGTGLAFTSHSLFA